MNFGEVVDEVDTGTLQAELAVKDAVVSPADWRWPSPEEEAMFDERACCKNITLESICATPLGFFLVITHMYASIDESMKVDFLVDASRYRSADTYDARMILGNQMEKRYFAPLLARFVSLAGTEAEALGGLGLGVEADTPQSPPSTSHSPPLLCPAEVRRQEAAAGLCRVNLEDTEGLDWQASMCDANDETCPLGLPASLLHYIPAGADTGGGAADEEKAEDWQGSRATAGTGTLHHKLRHQRPGGRWCSQLFDKADAIIFGFLKDIYGLSNVRDLPFWPMYVQYRAISDRAPSPADFSLFRVLGKGGFGLVSGCKHKASGQLYAMKVMDRRRVKLRKSLDLCMNERRALEHVSSPFVVQLHHAFVTPTELVLVMDLMQGGDLEYHLHRHHPTGVPLQEAKYFVARTVLGLSHLHEHHYVYRDLKPENVLLDEWGRSRLSDLGLVAFCPAGKPLVAVCGTPGYKAPEMIRRDGYSVTSDWFSLGCMLYELVCGVCPFHTEAARTFGLEQDTKAAGSWDEVACMDRATLAMEPAFDEPAWHATADHTSTDRADLAAVVDLCRCLLCKDPQQRLGGGGGGRSEIMAHRWFQGLSWVDVSSNTFPPPYVPEMGVNAANQSAIGEFVDITGVELDEADHVKVSDWPFVNIATFDADALCMMDSMRLGQEASARCCIIL